MDKTSQEAASAAANSTTASDSQAEKPAEMTAEQIAAKAAADLAASITAARILLLGHGFRVIVPNAQSARSTVVKADPTEVKAYFDSTKLSRAELADAVGVSTSVIATVQNVNGDRWSLERFQRAKVLIADAVALKGAAAKA